MGVECEKCCRQAQKGFSQKKAFKNPKIFINSPKYGHVSSILFLTVLYILMLYNSVLPPTHLFPQMQWPDHKKSNCPLLTRAAMLHKKNHAIERNFFKKGSVSHLYYSSGLDKPVSVCVAVSFFQNHPPSNDLLFLFLLLLCFPP